MTEMAEKFNPKLCDERHGFIAKKLDSIETKINGFLVLAITILAGLVVNFVKG